MNEPGRRTIVKVCGLTRVEDARAAADAGADWLGFIVRGESPRRIEPAAAAAIVAALPEAVAVAVMVGVGPDEAMELARAIGARRVQIHRADPADWPREFALPVTFAVPVADDGRLTSRLPAPEHLVMLDRAHETKAGGTGETFPWESAAALAVRRSVILAGGLDDQNVAEALERVRPFGVDAASRLEREPGIKDHERVRRFVAAVRAHDARQRAAS
ncbi:MAG: phosphoribosylanthranilate isomerase [Candidatus Eisenbacteria bacterium]|uniref:N-(5'-phosphoribosyl)anthranilate isomerase n=1 Tax=Eiseniibacteriota bacterium TaxID=2212470 RepID=A0A9D6L6T1_UNCEI|nr:phosphoribosylanthranilate isomerase [Candidatus Eisenbacteria bacterium]MBI3539968.1 phosphoribosylanthranilate isomerase [Candidatus Eisenbacteria bacterium]